MYLVLEYTCFSHQSDQVYLFLAKTLKESLHSRLFGTTTSTDESIRRIVQPEKNAPQRRTLQITRRQLEKRASSRATDRFCLTLNSATMSTTTNHIPTDASP